MGGINVHVPITFDDGVKCIARVRQKTRTSSLAEMARAITENEVKTMEVLRGVSDRVPEAFLPRTEELMGSGKGLA